LGGGGRSVLQALVHPGPGWTKKKIGGTSAWSLAAGFSETGSARSQTLRSLCEGIINQVLRTMKLAVFLPCRSLIKIG
jgi:hypothetical protein